MSDNQQTQHSRTSDFIRRAGEVQDKNLWGPAKWIVSMIQTLIALIMVTMGEAIAKIFTSEGTSRKKSEHDRT